MRLQLVLYTLCSLIAATVFAVAVAHAATCVSPTAASSGTATTSIIELYTSEGCDSCPPADKWFSSVKAVDAKIIPLAFHVDYWDYIGWKDRFGKPSFGERQRAEVARHGSRTVYTPQVMLNGRDWRAWAGGALANSVRELASKPARAELILQHKLEHKSDNKSDNKSENKLQTKPAASFDLSAVNLAVNLSVKVPDAIDRKESALFIAVTENNLVSRVNAGENRGVTLTHDHVVRELIGPITIRVDGTADITRAVKIGPDWKQADLRVAAFIQNQRSGEILQAVSSPVCR